MCTVGVLLLVAGVGSEGGTVQVPTAQTLPPAATSSSRPADGEASTTPPSANGSTSSTTLPLPEGATQVFRAGDVTSYVFRTPAGLASGEVEAAVAPTTVRVDDDGRGVTLSVGCARSSSEALAQVLVTESDRSITFAAIAASPTGAGACAADAAPRTVALVLPEPVDGRSVVVVPAGTPVPEIGRG